MLARIAISIAALLIGSATICLAATAEPAAAIVELETPTQTPQPLQGYLRQPPGAGLSPAVVLLHGCGGNWQMLDERWGKRIAAWGYVTLTVDSFGPRGIDNTCDGGAPVALAFDAYRALNFLVKQPFVDPARVAALGFAQGGWLALSSVERGIVEATAPNKFRAAAAFYPPCLDFKGEMTVPTLIMVGERDDWTLASECRNLAEGRDDYGISRRKGDGVPVKLIIYSNAYHAFDVPAYRQPVEYFGHRLEFNEDATERSVDALRDFLYATLGTRDQEKEPGR